MTKKQSKGVGERKHKWWHFILGRKFVYKVIQKQDGYEIGEDWYACRVCGEKLTPTDTAVTQTIYL